MPRSTGISNVLERLPRVPIERYLALLDRFERELVLDSYLQNIDAMYRLDERMALKKLVKSVQPRHSLASPLPVALVLERRIGVTLRAPLFSFGAPNVPGCDIQVSTYTTQGTTGVWKLALLGGASGTRAIQTSVKATYSAGAGEFKRIFIPIAATVIRRYLCWRPPPSRTGLTPNPIPPAAPLSRSGLRRDPPLRGFGDWHYESVLSSTARIRPLPGAAEEVVPSNVITTTPGIESLAGGGFSGRKSPLRGELLDRFALQGDSRGGLHRFERTFEESSEHGISAGADLMGFQIGASGTVKLLNGVQLKFTLVGGQDYRLYRTFGAPGLSWRFD